jgi:glycosyltransferase involved in cell wall biosynthesis
LENVVEEIRKRLRIAHLIYSPAVGGSEMIAADICARLDRSIFEPLVLFMYQAQGLMPEILSQRNIATYNLKQTRVKRLFGPLLLYKTLVGLRIDILHVHHVPLWHKIWRPTKLAKIPVILTEHAKYSISRSNKLQEACRGAAKTVSCFTAVSKDLKDYFVKEINIPEESIRVIPNGVDIFRFAPGPRNGVLRDLLPDEFSGKVLISVGRLTEAKDQSTLLSTIEILKKQGRNIYLIMVGDGEMRASLEEEIAQKELIHCVHLAGSRSDVPELLRGADAFVLSSKREGLPMSILEAMAAGLPVIATKVGGIPEVVKDGENGVLVPPQDQNSLANAICRVLDDSKFAAKLGRGARISIEENYSIKNITEAYSELYLSVIQRKSQ